MKKIVCVLLVLLIAGAGYFYLDRDIIKFELNDADVSFKSGEFYLVGRSQSDGFVTKVEAYQEKGDKLKEFTLDQITDDLLANSRFMSEMRYKQNELKGLKLTTEKINGENKLFYHFEYKGIDYKHKLVPVGGSTNFFYWNKIQVLETK